MDAVRVGLIGAGVIGAAHSLMLQQLAPALHHRIELVAVADPRAERRALFRELYGYRYAFAEAQAVLEHAGVNTVFVCSPTRYHAESVCAAAARGLHVFCEKPLAMSVAEGQAMVRAVEAAGVQSQIGLVLRYSAVYAVMRALLADPRAGRPLAVLFRDDQCFPIRGLHDSRWRADRSLTAGGTLIEHGVHDLDLLTWFFGPVARLRAWEQNRAGHPGVEDYMAVELEFAGGLRAQLVTLWHDMMQRPSNRRLEIFCERAFIASDHDMSGDVHLQLGDDAEGVVPAAEVVRRFLAMHPDVPESLRPWGGIAYLFQDLAFVRRLLDGAPAGPDLRAGLAAQQLAAAAYAAARTGAEVAPERAGVDS